MPHGAIPYPFGDCRICNDKATGVHYGVATCEGCKGFFKRSLSKAERYKCFFGGQCKLSPQNRNRCKSCRFQRCLNMGMSVEAVKMGRIPKVDKERALEMHRMVPGAIGPGSADIPSPGQVSTGPWNMHHTPTSTSHMPTGPPQPDIRQIAMNVLQERGAHGKSDSSEQAGSGQMSYYQQHHAPYHAEYHPHSQQAHSMPYMQQKTPLDMSSHHGYMQPHMAADSSAWDMHHHDMSGMQIAGLPEVLEGPRLKLPEGMIKSRQTSSDSGVSDLTSAEQSPLALDVSSNHSPQGNQASGRSEDDSSSSTSRPQSNNSNLHLYNPDVIQALLSQVIQNNQLDGLQSAMTNTGLTENKQASEDPEGTTMIPESVIKVEMPNPGYEESVMGYAHSQKLAAEARPCDLSRQEPSSSTENRKYRDNSDNWLSEISDSDNVGSSLDEDGTALLSKSYRQIEELYLKKFSLQQDWIPKAFDIITGRLEKHQWNLLESSTKEQETNVWQTLFANIVPWNTRILGFCSEVPGFTQLNREDQGYLLKIGYYDMWMLAVQCAFLNDESYFFMDNGMFYSRWWMMHFLPLKFILMMTRFWIELSQFHLKPVELGLLMAMRLVNPDRSELHQPDLVTVLQEHYINVLMYSLQKNHGTSSTQLWVKIMRLLPYLDDINSAQDEVIGNFQVDAPPDMWHCNIKELEDMGGDPKTLDFSSVLKIRSTHRASPTKLANLLNTS